MCKSCVFSKKYTQKWPFIAKSFVLSTHIMPFSYCFASNDRNLEVQISCSMHGCSKLPKNMTALVFLVSNSVKLTHKSKKSCNFRVFGLKKYENRKLCVSYVALHKKHVCNLCTHEKNICVTCVRYLKIEVENTTCVYVLYVWCAVLDSTLMCFLC